MSKITLAPNAAGTGTLTVAAPNTSTDYTLTLPTATTTLVGTDATQTLTNKSIAGSQLTGTVAGSLLTGSVASSLLTGALPAIDGSALTGIVTGGMTLLGTITTTSGSTQTLSGLTLTSYQQIVAVVKDVSATSNFLLQFSSLNMVTSVTATNSVFGILTVDLTTGVWVFPATIAIGTLSTNANASTASWMAGIQNTITTSSTSISFSTSAGTFDYGSIRIYGVK